jgi:hypothetical protein
LEADGEALSPAMVAIILKPAGFAKLPRRADEERPPGARPEAAADVRQLDWTPRRLRTPLGGLFLFMPGLAPLPFEHLLKSAGLPDSRQIPAGAAVRSLLGLKLLGNPRHSPIMSRVFDEGRGVLAGLNLIPQRSFLTEYRCRIDPACYPKRMRGWFEARGQRGVSLDLDFHTLPFHGEEALLEKHYVSKRSRGQQGVLAFLAQDAEQRVFCYANAELRKAEPADEILRFIEFWPQRTGRLPEERVFDSRLTTHKNLNRLNELNIGFLTWRWRSRQLLEKLKHLPSSAWRRGELKNVTRAYRTPRVLDTPIRLKDYDGPLRPLTLLDRGQEEPTLLLTNPLRTSAAKRIERYAQRMVIENSLDFFHLDARSSAGAMKVNCDLPLTLMARSLYRLLGARIGNGYQHAKSRHLFRDFVEAPGHLTITEPTGVVHFQKHAPNPLLIAAGFGNTDVPIPGLGGKRLQLYFG